MESSLNHSRKNFKKLKTKIDSQTWMVTRLLVTGIQSQETGTGVNERAREVRQYSGLETVLGIGLGKTGIKDSISDQTSV